MAAETVIPPQDFRANCERLAAYVDALPDGTYTHANWWCGTAGCLLGHAAHSGLFPGLVLVAGRPHPYPAIVGDCDEMRAAAVFFGPNSFTAVFDCYAPWVDEEGKGSDQHAAARAMREYAATLPESVS